MVVTETVREHAQSLAFTHIPSVREVSTCCEQGALTLGTLDHVQSTVVAAAQQFFASRHLGVHSPVYRNVSVLILPHDLQRDWIIRAYQDNEPLFSWSNGEVSISVYLRSRSQPDGSVDEADPIYFAPEAKLLKPETAIRSRELTEELVAALFNHQIPVFGENNLVLLKINPQAFPPFVLSIYPPFNHFPIRRDGSVLLKR